MTTVVICAGGPEQELCSFTHYASREDSLFIGVDRGAYYLLKRNISPHAIVGDFDSLTVEEWLAISSAMSHAHIERYKQEKDETDTDLALLKALTFQPSTVIVTGVTGGRLDHYEAAVRSVYRFTKQFPNVSFIIVNDKNSMQFLMAGKHIVKKEHHYRYLSFFAYESDVRDVTLRGVKYETTNAYMSIGSSMFTSNELIDASGSISFSSGICLMIRSID